jgi:hypothetical protein
MDNVVSAIAKNNILWGKVIIPGQCSFKIKTTAVRITVDVRKGRTYSP